MAFYSLYSTYKINKPYFTKRMSSVGGAFLVHSHNIPCILNLFTFTAVSIKERSIIIWLRFKKRKIKSKTQGNFTQTHNWKWNLNAFQRDNCSFPYMHQTFSLTRFLGSKLYIYKGFVCSVSMRWYIKFRSINKSDFNIPENTDAAVCFPAVPVTHKLQNNAGIPWVKWLYYPFYDSDTGISVTDFRFLRKSAC